MEAHDTVDNVMVRYHYDGKGRRVAKWVDDSYSGSFVARKRYEYLYEGDEPIADYVEVSGTFVITHRYLHGASVDERLVHWSYDQNTGAETAEQFYHRDHQGSIVAMSDASGDRVTGELYTYDAYGNMGLGNTDGQPFRYTGRRWDDETGLYYYRARYYSAELGRFLQTDPIGYEDNMNLYAYTANDPINNTDPTGKCPMCVPEKATTPEQQKKNEAQFGINRVRKGLGILAIAATAASPIPGDEAVVIGAVATNAAKANTGGKLAKELLSGVSDIAVSAVLDSASSSAPNTGGLPESISIDDVANRDPLANTEALTLDTKHEDRRFTQQLDSAKKNVSPSSTQANSQQRTRTQKAVEAFRAALKIFTGGDD